MSLFSKQFKLSAERANAAPHINPKGYVRLEFHSWKFRFGKSFAKKAIIPLVFMLLMNLMPFTFSRADEVTDAQQQEIQLYLQAQQIKDQLRAEAEALKNSLRPPEPEPTPSPTPTPESTTTSEQPPQSSTGSNTEEGPAPVQSEAEVSPTPATSSSGETSAQTPNSTTGNASGSSGSGGISTPFEDLVANLHKPTTDVSTTTPDASVDSGGQGTSIQNQGDDSIIVAENTATSSEEIITDNQANVTNTKDVVSDSGNNTIACNGICEGKLTTGNANSDTSSGNKINTSNVSSGGSGAMWAWMRYGTGPQSDIENGGDGAVNIGDNTFVRDLAIIQKNDALLKNEYNVVANTGGNDLLTTFKLKNFDAVTGEARSRLTLLNMVNTNLVDSEWWPLYVGIDKEFNSNINIMDELLKQFGSTAKFNLFDPNPTVSIQNSGEDSFNKTLSNLQIKLNANSENSGLIQNKIRVACNTGHNTASSPYKIKDLNLTTGDCGTSLTLLNFLNTYLVNAQWAMPVINVFGKWAGDLVLPAPDELLNTLYASESDREIVMTNSGEDAFSKAFVVDRTEEDIFVKNDLNVKSRVNTVTSAGNDFIGFADDLEDSSVQTGNATNLSSQFMLGNSTKVGGGFFSLFVNDLSKKWLGGIEGAPEDAHVQRDGRGAVVVAERSGQLPQEGVTVNRSRDIEIDNSGGDALNIAEITRDRHVIINSSNNGSIVNDITVEAYTGENIITGLDGRRIHVKDGDAQTNTTIGNVVNTTMIGAKAMNVIVNVFGEWSGKVVFGKAVDLIATMLSSASGQLQPGQDVTYTVQYENANDKEATTNAKLTANYDYQKMDLVDNGGATEIAPGKLQWNIGDMPASGTGSKTFTARVKSGLPVGEHTIQATGEITSTRPESNKDNNTDSTSATVTIASAGASPTTPPQNGTPTPGSGQAGEGTVGGAITPGTNPSAPPGSGQAGGSPSTSSGNNGGGQFGAPGGSNTNGGSAVTLRVQKSAKSGSTVTQGGSVKYEVIVQNTGTEEARDVKLFDKLRVNGKASPDDEFSWQIGKIMIGEQVTVAYDVNIEPGAELGSYVNTAYASGFDSRNKVVMSNDSQAVVTVTQGAAGSVQPATTGASGGSGTQSSGGSGEAENTNTGSSNENPSTPLPLRSGNNNIAPEAVEGLPKENHSAPQNVTVRNADGTIRSNTNSTYGEAKISRTIPLGVGVQTASAQEVRVQPKNTNGPTQEVAFNNLDKVLGEQVARQHHYGFLMWLWMILLILLVIVGYLAWREQRKSAE